MKGTLHIKDKYCTPASDTALCPSIHVWRICWKLWSHTACRRPQCRSPKVSRAKGCRRGESVIHISVSECINKCVQGRWLLQTADRESEGGGTLLRWVGVGELMILLEGHRWWHGWVDYMSMTHHSSPNELANLTLFSQKLIKLSYWLMCTCLIESMHNICVQTCTLMDAACR